VLDTTPADDRVILSENSSDTQVENDIDDGAILTKSGHYIGVDGETTALGVNDGARDCLLAGSYTFRVPRTTP